MGVTGELSRIGRILVSFGFITLILEGTAVAQSNTSCDIKTLTATEEEQYISSPNYPDHYGRNLVCTWVIRGNTNHVVRLYSMFTHVESCNSCGCDSLRAYDGPDTVSPIIKKWCGFVKPTIYSTGPALTLEFRTDRTNQYKGFMLRYAHVTDSCKGNLRASRTPHKITSPGFPSAYPHNILCTWTVKAATEGRIRLVFLDVDIFSEKNCTDDYVVVYDVLDTGVKHLGTFCGRNQTSYTSWSDTVRIEFYTDYTGRGRGFQIQYFSGSFRASRRTNLVAYSDWKIFSSPDYPNSYPDLIDYYWTIQSLNDKNVVCVETEDFIVEKTAGCTKDYVEVFDGNSDDSDSLGRWCGYSLHQVCSSTRYLFIKFHTDSEGSATGYRIKYKNSFNSLVQSSGDISVNTGALIGSFAGVIAILWIAWCWYRHRRHKRNTESPIMSGGIPLPPPVSSQDSAPPLSSAPPSFTIPSDAPVFTVPISPPSYSDVIKADLEHSDAPPSYESIQWVSSDIQNPSTNSPSAPAGVHQG